MHSMYYILYYIYIYIHFLSALLLRFLAKGLCRFIGPQEVTSDLGTVTVRTKNQGGQLCRDHAGFLMARGF